MTLRPCLDRSQAATATILVLAGGEILVRGAAVVRLEQAGRHALDAARREALVPPDVAALADALREAVTRQRRGSASGTSELPQPALPAASDHDDDLEVPDVARIAGISREYARRLCRSTFTTARQDGRRWLVDRIEVEQWASARHRKAS